MTYSQSSPLSRFAYNDRRLSINSIGRARTVVDEEFDFEVDGIPLVEHSEIYSLVPYDCCASLIPLLFLCSTAYF